MKNSKTLWGLILGLFLVGTISCEKEPIDELYEQEKSLKKSFY